jgi:outer membrane protein OmpA-like peptidoglycan-associated protein
LEKAKQEKENRKTITPPAEIWVTIHFNHFLFGFNQSEVSKLNNQGLDSLALFLTQHTETKIEIIGYADAVGRDEYNAELSAKRAHTLEKYLSGKGVSAAQMSIVGFGEENPIALNSKNDGSWYKESQVFNRRAEFRVIQQSNIKLRFKVMDNIPEQYKDANYNSEYQKK